MEQIQGPHKSGNTWTSSERLQVRIRDTTCWIGPTWRTALTLRGGVQADAGGPESIPLYGPPGAKTSVPTCINMNMQYACRLINRDTFIHESDSFYIRDDYSWQIVPGASYKSHYEMGRWVICVLRQWCSSKVRGFGVVKFKSDGIAIFSQAVY